MTSHENGVFDKLNGISYKIANHGTNDLNNENIGI